MYKVKEIFDKYNDEIARLQYKNFNPTSTQDFNAENKKTTFQLDLENNFISKNIQYYIAGEFSSTDASKAYNNKSNVKMIDNFVAHLFSHIEVKKHNTTIDEIDYPGIASTVKGCVEYPGLNVYNGKAITSGFKSSNYEVAQFEAVGNLGNLGLGFFNDIKVPIYRGGFEIIFTRNSDNNVICRWKGKKADGSEDPASLPNEGKITIKNFYLRVPIIEYNSEAQIKLIKELFDNSYFFQFKKWQCIQQMKVSGKTLHLDITNVYRNVTNPIWAFVVFQTNKSNNQLKDNGTFDHANVKNLWLEVGGKRYPEESWDLDFDNNYYALAYEAFQDFKRCFFKTDSIPYVDKKGFKSMYPIYSVDLTDQPQNISNVKSNIVLHVDFNKAVPDPTGSDEGTICYIVVVSNCLLRYEPDKNKITQVNN